MLRDSNKFRVPRSHVSCYQTEIKNKKKIKKFSDLYKQFSEIVFRGIFCPHVVDLVEPDQPGLVFARLQLNMFCVSGHDFRVKIAGGGF